MKLIKTKWYPFGRFIAITHYPIGVFYKGTITDKTLNHEAIHWRQQKELFVIPFYLVYLFEFIIKGYRNISFEKEAYNNAHNFKYLQTRPRFNMWKNQTNHGSN